MRKQARPVTGDVNESLSIHLQMHREMIQMKRLPAPIAVEKLRQPDLNRRDELVGRDAGRENEEGDQIKVMGCSRLAGLNVFHEAAIEPLKTIRNVKFRKALSEIEPALENGTTLG